MVTYTYGNWGKLISTEGDLASTLGAKNPLRYRGYYYDTETGLYYLQSRYYNPKLCRFISADDPSYHLFRQDTQYWGLETTIKKELCDVVFSLDYSVQPPNASFGPTLLELEMRYIIS